MSFTTLFKFIGVMFIVGSGFFLIVSFRDMKTTLYTIKFGETISAEVVSIDFNRRYSPPVQILVLKYKINGIEYTKRYEKHTTNWQRKKIGEIVPILYNPNLPNQFWIKSDINFYLFKIIALDIFLFLAGILIFHGRRQLSNLISSGAIEIGG
jgi:hypothetical protein